MLPMLWAPRPGDATPAPEFAPSAPMPQELELWPEAATLAEQFWTRVEADARVSDGFRPHAAAAFRAVRGYGRVWVEWQWASLGEVTRWWLEKIPRFHVLC